MARHHERLAIRIFHALVAILILLAGGGMLGIGIWMTVTESGGPLNLEYSGDSFFRIVLSVNIASLILGGFLLLTGIVSLIALSRQCLGMTFRVIYVIMAAVILAILILICVISSMILAQSDRNEVRHFIEEAWGRTVTNSPEIVCDIEERFQCRGFKDGDCTICKTGTEPECAATDNCALCIDRTPLDSRQGCYDEIISNFHSLFLPSAIVSAVLGAVVLADIIVTWCI